MPVLNTAAGETTAGGATASAARGAELDELVRGLFAERGVGHLQAEVARERGLVALEERPVEGGEGAGAGAGGSAGIVLAVTRRSSTCG